MTSSAASVGQGVARVKIAKPVKLKVDSKTTPLSEASAVGDWTDVPEVPGMLEKPGAFKLTNKEVIIFDLSNPEDLKRYNTILTNDASPQANVCIEKEDVKFVEETQSWKVLLKIQHIQFRKILKKGIKPGSVEAQEELQQGIM